MEKKTTMGGGLVLIGKTNLPERTKGALAMLASLTDFAHVENPPRKLDTWAARVGVSVRVLLTIIKPALAVGGVTMTDVPRIATGKFAGRIKGGRGYESPMCTLNVAALRKSLQPDKSTEIGDVSTVKSTETRGLKSTETRQVLAADTESRGPKSTETRRAYKEFPREEDPEKRPSSVIRDAAPKTAAADTCTCQRCKKLFTPRNASRPGWRPRFCDKCYCEKRDDVDDRRGPPNAAATDDYRAELRKAPRTDPPPGFTWRPAPASSAA